MDYMDDTRLGKINDSIINEGKSYFYYISVARGKRKGGVYMYDQCTFGGAIQRSNI